jgi:hypothetical protein
MNNGYTSLWPTDILLGTINDSNLLSKIITSSLTEITPETTGTFNEYDPLKDGPAVFQEFRDNVVWPAFSEYLSHWNIDLKKFEDRRLRSWFTGHNSGYMIPAHNHSGATLSAVFYFMNEEHDKGGELVLMDPRANANRGYKDNFKSIFENVLFQPKSGEYLVFPSFVYHHTMPFRGNLRLAMPVDLFL